MRLKTQQKQPWGPWLRSVLGPGDHRMRAPLTATLLVAALALQGCSSRPREFRPALAAEPASRTSFEADVAECRQLLVSGKLDSNGQMASAGAGAAASVATAAVGGTTAAAVGGLGGFAAASATVVLLPFAAVAGAWRMAKTKKNKKERAVQQAMAGCLIGRGHQVIGWEPASRKASPAVPATARPR
jgi:hypothetical protein